MSHLPGGFAQQQALLGRCGQDAPAAALLDQSGMVKGRIETEDRESKAILALRLAVTARGIAAVTRQQRRDVVLEVEAARTRRIAHLDSDSQFFSAGADLQR